MTVNRPAWSYAEGKSDKNKKPRVQSGLRSVGGAKSWCYKCRFEHVFGDPCGAPSKLAGFEPDPDAPLVPCGVCSTLSAPSPFNRSGSHYCSEKCKRRAKHKREWAREKALREEKAG